MPLSLKHDLEWKLVYVGCAEDEKYDQVLETVYVGPVRVGHYRFVFQADPPDVEVIPEEDILGVTAILLTCSYRGREFIRIGYYVSNEYIEQELIDDPPNKVVIEKVQRVILACKPRVSRFPISFHSLSSLSLPLKQHQQLLLCGGPPLPSQQLKCSDAAEDEFCIDSAVDLSDPLEWF